jgi:hypothetical protein
MKFRVESAVPELPVEPFEIELASGRVVSFIGYNATLKSLTAKALLHELCRTADLSIRFVKRLETRTEDAAKVLKVDVYDAPEGALLYLVDDYRLALRAYFSVVENMIKELRGIADTIADGKAKETALGLLDELEYNLAPQLRDYVEMKEHEDGELFAKAQEIAERALKSVSEEVALDSALLLPLYIEVTPREYIVRDRRLKGGRIPLNIVSTTVAAALLWGLTIRFFSIPASARVFVVEEPEEAMTPLQQVAYVEALKALAREIPGENYVVLTTHSPYIAGASDQPSYHFSFENGRFTCSPASVPLPMAKADALLLVRTAESEGGSA